MDKSIKLLVLLYCLLSSAYVRAYIVIDGLEYGFSPTTKEASVVRGCDGDITIPSEIEYEKNKYTVISIGSYAFSGCSGLTSITIPNSVTEIGSSAFSGCSGLTSITIPKSVTVIGFSAFYGCLSLTSVTIPKSVTVIGSSAFIGCSGLTSITIPNSATKIGEKAFSGCTGLKELILEDGEEKLLLESFLFSFCPLETLYLGRDLYNYNYYTKPFKNFKTLTSLTISNSVTSIGDEAFYNCSSLTSVAIPNSVTEIGEGAFLGCSGLTSVNIGNSVTKIGNSAFKDCLKLTSVTIGNSVTEIGSEAFFYCRGLTSVTIPNSVTGIGNSAFKDCLKLTSVTIGNSVTEIGSEVFSYCRGLTSVTIPNSVIEIGGSAFSYCSGLTSVTIPNSVIEIGQYAFSYCSGLTSVTIPNSVTEIGQYAFNNCSGLTSVTIPNSVTGIGNSAFKDCSKLTSVNIGNSVTEIGSEAFSYCRGLTSVTIPNSVTSIGSKAFSYCSGLTSIAIPNSVTTIGYDAFHGCKGLKELTLEDGEKKLSLGLDHTSNGLFYDCPLETLYLGRKLTYNSIVPTFKYKETLTSVIIGNSVTAIYSGDFNGCGSIKNITSLNLVPPVLPGNGFDKAVYKNATLRVPDDSLDDYKVANGWKNFFTILGTSDIIPEAIELEIAEIELIEGETATLKATITPENTTITTLTWSSSDETIATVDASGKVTAINAGTATITATCGELTATCEVTVSAATIDATGLTLNLEEAEIIEGNTLQLSATVTPDNATNKTIKWASSDSDIATIDSNGLVTAVKPGTATITATTSTGLTAKCEITVIAATIDATGLTLNIEEAEMIEGNTLHLIATVAPDNALDKTIKWVSSDISVATVDVNGFVSAIKVGKATITATCGELTATCEVTVTVRQTAIDGVDSDLQDAVRVEGNSIIAPEGSVVYDLNGRRVKATNLAKGIYIVRTPDGKSVKVRL